MAIVKKRRILFMIGMVCLISSAILCLMIGAVLLIDAITTMPKWFAEFLFCILFIAFGLIFLCMSAALRNDYKQLNK